MVCAPQVHAILMDLGAKLNPRAFAAAKRSHKHTMSMKKWRELLTDFESAVPRLGLYQGSLVLACADYQLWIATTLICANTRFADIAMTAELRGLGSLRQAAISSGVSVRNYHYYLRDREPKIWDVLRMAQRLGSAEIRHKPDWFWGWAGSHNASRPTPLAQDPLLVNSIAQQRMAGATAEELAHAFGTTPAEIERVVCGWVRTRLPGECARLIKVTRKKRR